MNVRIRDIALSMRMMDGESLLTPELLSRIASAVAEQLRSDREDARARDRDTRIGDDSCTGGCGGGAHADP